MTYRYNLLSPTDYLKLLYVVFFNWRKVPKPEERRQQLVLVGQALLLMLVANLMIGLAIIWSGGTFEWDKMAFGVAGGMVIGMAIAVLGALAEDVVGGVAIGVAVGMAGGMAGGLAGGVAGGVVGGVAFGVAGGVVLGMAFGVAGGVAFGVAFGMAEAIGEWGGTLLGGGVAGLIAFWGFLIAFILAFILAFNFNSLLEPPSANADWQSRIVLLALSSIGAGYLFTFLDGWLPLNAPLPLITAVIFVLAHSRLPLWPVESVWALGVLGWRGRTGSAEELKDAIQWAYFDRHAILPLPGEAWALRRLARLDHDYALPEAIDLARYSGHLLASVSALQSFAQYDPLGTQAHILKIADTNERKRLLRYVAYHQPAPAERAWRVGRQLSQLGSRLLPKREQPNDNITEQASSVIQLASRLMEMDDKQRGEQEEPTLSEIIATLEQALQELRLAQQLDPDLWHISEVLGLYDTLLQAISSEQFEAITSFSCPPLPEKPTVLFPRQLREMIAALGEVALTVRGYTTATSLMKKSRAILQANEQIEQLTPRLDQIPSPAGPLVALVVVRWRQILVSVGGELVRSEVSARVANPYVVGNPVTGHLFVGREDILRRLEELWAGEGACPSVVIYGHRRMGKTSILHNLGVRFGAGTTVVNFSMQLMGRIPSTSQLLLNLAFALYDVLPAAQQAALSEPDEERFLKHDPYTALRRFLTQVERIRTTRRFLIMVDEFELIEEAIDQGRLEAELLGFWRGLIQNNPWFVMAFAGLHTLHEMTQDYWHPLFGSVTTIPVSFLRPKATYRLITQPTPDFDLDYDADAIKRIIALTNGQPYLVQLICHGLVTRFNRQMFEQEVPRERRFSLADVEAVISAPEFFREGAKYFTGVWQQAANGTPASQLTILHTLAPAPSGLPLTTIAQKSGLTPPQSQAALNALALHDIVTQQNGRWSFTVELMRRWVSRPI